MQVQLKSSKNTRLLIAETGKSLRSFSESIGVSQGYLSQVLSGRYNPSPTVAFKIANGLNLEIKDIFLVNMTDISISENGVM